MKVLLFRPRPHKETIGLQNVMICEPLELEYISSNIEALGHKCRIVDMILEKKDIAFFVMKYRPDVVGITGYISHVNIMKDYARQVKECDPRIKTIIGGVHAEVNPQDFESEYVDYIIRANGIRTFIEVLGSIEGRTSAENIACVAGVLAAVLFYAIALFALRGITKDDILMLPKGRKIAKTLEKYGLIG